MKKIILACILVFLGLTTHAQKGVYWSNASILKGETRLNVVFDYSEAVLDGMTIEAMASLDENWEKGSKEAMARFCKEFVKHCQVTPALFVGPYPEAKYTLTLKVLKVDDDGECYVDVIISDNDGNIILNAPKMNGDGGRFGSFTNLMGDGYENLSRKLAVKIRNAILIGKKK